MKLRKLRPEDAEPMLQWMHDSSVVEHLGTNFAEKTLEDCQRFIAYSQTAECDLHLAVTDDGDEYMGTVSLKHIDRANRTAEFAITVRAAAMGRGYSRFAMERILEMGLGEMGLEAIYWCVAPVNCRAIRFYDKCGYQRTEDVPDYILAPYPVDMELLWYVCRG